MESERLKNGSEGKIFIQRLDFYWKFMAVYAIAFIMYALLRGSIEDGNFSLFLKDPIVILFAIFILAALLGLFVNWYKKREIIIYKNEIVFKSRFREKKYSLNDVKRIAFGKIKSLQKRRRNEYRVIKIKVNNRRRVIRIRPTSFWDDRELTQELSRLKKIIK